MGTPCHMASRMPLAPKCVKNSLVCGSEWVSGFVSGRKMLSLISLKPSPRAPFMYRVVHLVTEHRLLSSK